MLYVFQMDVGQMLTFDISLLMDSVSRLQEEIVKTTGIPIDKQILLVSGGHSLKPDQKVMTYGAGADTNPVFLFSKLAIESQEAPLVRSVTLSKDLLSSLKDRITEAINLPVNFDTVTKRTKIACQIRDSANRILSFCSNEFKEQHLQYQGWGTVVANLEEIAQAMQKTEIKFSKAFAAFLPQRELHFTMLENFSETLDLLDRIPLIKSLKATELQELSSSGRSSDLINSRSQVSKSLLDWITNQGQGQSLEALQHQSYDELLLFNSEMFEQCDRQVQELLASVNNDPHQMKELVGIGRRLSELEKRLNDAKKIAKEQSDMAQGFLNHQARLNSTHDALSVLPDLCKSHKQQLVQMLERQQRMEALQNNFRKSKQEMSTNIHQRLGWVMHIETQISKLDTDLIFHMKTLRILECNLELLNQVKAAPQVYANMVVEAARRKCFSLKFSQWADSLVEDSCQLYQQETERRKQFAKTLGDHFLLETLFKGFDDMPPSFATKPPQPFDLLLPDITTEDINFLKNSVPELEELLRSAQIVSHLRSLSLDTAVFPQLPWIRGQMSSSMVIPHSQSSQTEWTQQEVEAVSPPSVITATEAPPFKFTLPELQESHMMDNVPAVTVVTDTVKDAITSSLKTTDLAPQPSTSPGLSHITSTAVCYDPPSVLSSANATDSSSAEVPVKVQSKVNSDSTSPISSNEFATADFYFEDSMPSPMADSPLGKKEKKKGEDSKTDLELITSLHAELAEKTLLIQDLERKLKERDIQLSESGRTASQRELSSDGSSTLIGKVDASDQSSTELGLVQSTGDVSEGTNIDFGAVSRDATDSVNIDTGAVSKDATDSVLAKTELDRLRENLLDVETKLEQMQSQKDEEVKVKVRAIADLENQIKTVSDELSQSKCSIRGMEEGQASLKQALCDSRTRCQHLEAEVKKGEGALMGVHNKLKEFRYKLKMDIPYLKETLTELRGAVLDNKSELDVSVAAAMASVEREVSLFTSTVLAAACSDFRQEKEALSQEIQQLKASLHLANSESEEKFVHLTLVRDELTNEIGRMQQEFDQKYREQQSRYETTVRDLETKHAIETELEVDRCRADIKESLEEAERDKETLRRHCEDLEQRLSGTEKMKNEMVKCHNEQIQEFEIKFAAEKAAMAKEHSAELENKITGHNKDITELQASLECVTKNLTEDKMKALESLKEQMTAEREAAMSEIRQQVEEQKENITKLLEQKQLDYAQKLTLIKTQFDIERESLQEEVNKYKNRERSDIATQLDYDLLSEIMTHSETQTGLELLAEVISLTSSASYGSEEMIAHKLQPSCLEEKPINDLNEASKLLPTADDFSLQLAKAHEKISKLEEEISILRQEKQELTDQFSSDGQKRPLLKLSMSQSQFCGAEHPRYQDLMQTSNTTSFTVMTREVSVDETQHEQGAANTESIKDKTIAELEKKLMEIPVVKEKDVTSDKVSIRGCDRGDLVLLCLDERHDQYVVFTIGTNLHFLHSESLECLGLQTGIDAAGRKSWILAEVVDKEYCLAKKPNNRFRVPEGTCFYRVRCKPWKSDVDFTRQKRETGRQMIKTTKMDHGLGVRPKKEKK